MFVVVKNNVDQTHQLDPVELDRLFADIFEGKDRLHMIEIDIAEGLRERPLRTWCVGCHKLLRTIHAKATGRDWRTI